MSRCRISKKMVEEMLSEILQGRGAGKVPVDKALTLLRYAAEDRLNTRRGAEALIEVLESMNPEKAAEIRGKLG